MKNVMKIIMYATLGIAALAMVFFPESWEIFAGLGTAGTMTAGIAAPGTVTFEDTDTLAPQHKQRSISQIVTSQKPDEFALDQFLRKIRKAERVHNPKVEYETYSIRGREDQLGAVFNAAGNAGDASVDLAVDSVNIWGVDDVVYTPLVNGGDGKPLRMHVMSVDRAGGNIKVVAINGPGVNPERLVSLPDNTLIKRIGSAKNELDSTTDIITQIPSQDYNYCQIQMCQIERSKMEAQTKAYSGDSYNRKVQDNIYTFRSDCEFTAMYGSKAKRFNSVTSKYIYHADGITNKITNISNFGSGGGSVDPSIADVADMLEQGFAGNSGSEKRLLLVGSNLANKLSLLPLVREIGELKTKIVHGVTVSELHSRFGTVYIKHSKTMDIAGDKQSGYLIDLSNVFRHELEPMVKEMLDPDKAGLRRVQDAYRITENACVSLRYQDTHLKWTPTA